MMTMIAQNLKISKYTIYAVSQYYWRKLQTGVNNSNIMWRNQLSDGLMVSGGLAYSG